jgi:hypothetical protein
MKIAKDKKLHLAAGFLIGGVAAGVTGFTGLGTLLAGVAGYGKEVWDRRQNKQAIAKDLPEPNKVDRADVAFTIVGGAIADVVVFGARYIGGL